MDKKIIRHLGYELEYAEIKHCSQKESLEGWLKVIVDKAQKCIDETNMKEHSFNKEGFSHCGWNCNEERFSVLFACMSIAYRAVINKSDDYYLNRLKYFKGKEIELDTVDEIELKIEELEELKRQKEMEECED